MNHELIKTTQETPKKEVVKTYYCALCEKEIPLGQEVKIIEPSTYYWGNQGPYYYRSLKKERKIDRYGEEYFNRELTLFSTEIEGLKAENENLMNEAVELVKAELRSTNLDTDQNFINELDNRLTQQCLLITAGRNLYLGQINANLNREKEELSRQSNERGNQLNRVHGIITQLREIIAENQREKEELTTKIELDDTDQKLYEKNQQVKSLKKALKKLQFKPSQGQAVQTDNHNNNKGQATLNQLNKVKNYIAKNPEAITDTVIIASSLISTTYTFNNIKENIKNRSIQSQVADLTGKISPANSQQLVDTEEKKQLKSAIAKANETITNLTQQLNRRPNITAEQENLINKVITLTNQTQTLNEELKNKAANNLNYQQKNLALQTELDKLNKIISAQEQELTKEKLTNQQDQETKILLATINKNPNPPKNSAGYINSVTAGATVTANNHNDYDTIKAERNDYKGKLESVNKRLNSELKLGLVGELELDKIISKIKELINKPNNIEELKVANQTITDLEKQLNDDNILFQKISATIKQSDLKMLHDLGITIPPQLKIQLEQAANYQELSQARQAIIQHYLTQNSSNLSIISNQKTQYKKISLEQALVEISQLVTDIYQHNLFTAPGQKLLVYLQKNRQINSDLINRFSLGGTINNKQITNLFYSENKSGFSPAELSLTNLWQVTDDNRVYDFFSAQQLIFPLTNEEGKIVAFAARKIEVLSGESKYLYLPSYSHYQKSSLLYNYPTVKQNLSPECYLVEGFFDVISLTRLGIENCLALSGTNLSEKQIKLLKNLRKRMILFLDGDLAGQEATIHIATTLLLREIDCEEEIKENPQRIAGFIQTIAKIFRPFKVAVHNFLIEKVRIKIISAKEERKLLISAKKGKGAEQENAIRSIVYYNLNLVNYIVKRYFSFAGLSPDDLVAEGVRSLPKAIEKFDLANQNRFAVYAGCWIKQYIRSYIEKTQFIKQSATNPEKKSVIYYDSNYQNDDKESKSYSLLDTLNDSENPEMNNEQIRQRDITQQINSLINSLGSREMILLIRLLYKIVPTSLLDIYYLATEEEKEILLKELKLSSKKAETSLINYSCQEKKPR
ncbi:1020_t:CDS:10 [Entrophospora sp. SA101]|nr:1020_t:CDS:10 [Entrophospora sp. SA101]